MGDKKNEFIINENWVLRKDAYSIELVHRIPTKKGTIREALTWHGNILQVLQYLYDEGVRENLGDLEKIKAWRDELSAKFASFENIRRL